MKITPVDIQHKQFRKALQGYAREDVDSFLDGIIESLEELIEERSKLEAELAELKEKVSHFAAMEASLQSTLVLAQRTADELKASAHKEIDLLKQQARLSLDNELRDVKRQIEDAKRDLQRLHDQQQVVKQDLRSFLSRHLAMIEDARAAAQPLLANSAPSAESA